MTLTCDYCAEDATLLSALSTNEPLCRCCAQDHYGADWRSLTIVLTPARIAALSKDGN